MSAFGHAGFGSSNRRNQLRAQGQIGADTYGQGVRNAMQAPTMNIYSAPQTYQQATGQQAQQPTAAPQTNQPSTPAGQPAPPAFTTDSEQPDTQTYTPPPSPGTAQPIQPQSTGTTYNSPVSSSQRNDRLDAIGYVPNPLYGITDGNRLAKIAAQFHHAGLPVPPELTQAVSGLKTGQLDGRYVSPDMWSNAPEDHKTQFLLARDGKGDPIIGADNKPVLDIWSQEQMQNFVGQLEARRNYIQSLR